LSRRRKSHIIDNLLEKRWSRNATLVQGLAALDIIEELGFGLNRMVAVMADAGLPAPVFADNGDTFVVTLYGHGRRLLTPPDSAAGERGERLSAASATPRRQQERQEWALDYLRTMGPLSPQAYAAALTISIDTAKRDLRDLMAQGRVKAQGSTRNRRYTLAE